MTFFSLFWWLYCASDRLNITFITQVFGSTLLFVQLQVKRLSSQLINLMTAGLSFSTTAGHTDMLSDIGVHRTQLICAAGFMDGKMKKIIMRCCLLIWISGISHWHLAIIKRVKKWIIWGYVCTLVQDSCSSQWVYGVSADVPFRNKNASERDKKIVFCHFVCLSHCPVLPYIFCAVFADVCVCVLFV